MERAEIAETITELMEDVFDVDDLVYSDDLDASQVEEWDSLSNIRFIVAIEQAFGIRFSNKEVESLQNVGELVDTVKAKQG